MEFTPLMPLDRDAGWVLMAENNYPTMKTQVWLRKMPVLDSFCYVEVESIHMETPSRDAEKLLIVSVYDLIEEDSARYPLCEMQAFQEFGYTPATSEGN
jgi:hypothetical protein